MAKVSSKRSKLEFDVEIDSEMLSAFKCSVCLDFFSKPKVLPNCGHTLCSGCVKKVRAAGGIKCPECRSTLGSRKLKSNVSIQKAIDAFGIDSSSSTDQNPAVKKGVLGEFCPHVGFVSKSTSKCGHCDKEFCSLCLIAHMERLKLELDLMVLGFAKRLEEVKKNMTKKINSLRKFVQENVDSIQAKIKSSSEEVITAQDIATERDALVKKAQNLGNDQFRKLNGFVRWIADKRNLKEVIAAAESLHGSSVLFISCEKVTNAYNLAINFDRKLSTVQEAFKNVLHDKIVFNEWKCNDDGNFGIASVELIGNGLSKVPWVYKEYHSLAFNGTREQMKSLFEQEGMSAGCKQLLVNHLDGTHYDASGLVCASCAGNLDVVKYLVLEQNVDFVTSSELNDSAFSAALILQRIEILRFFLDAAPELLHKKTSEDCSILHMAAYDGLNKVVKFLIHEKSMSINSCVAELGRTPLFQAVFGGNLETVKLLVEEEGADVNFLINKTSVFHIAANTIECKIDVFRYLASVSRQVINERGPDGATPLTLAIKKERLDVVEFLVKECQVDLDVRTFEGITAAMEAVSTKQLGMLQLLADYGADLGIQDDPGNTVLHWAVGVNSMEIVEFLLERRIDLLPVKRNFDGKNAIMFARSLAYMYGQQMVKFLQSKSS